MVKPTIEPLCLTCSLLSHTHCAKKGHGSSSQQELFKLLHRDGRSGSGLDVEQLLEQVARLAMSLKDQAGSDCDLVVASSLWTKNWPIKPEYAADVRLLFQVRGTLLLI